MASPYFGGGSGSGGGSPYFGGSGGSKSKPKKKGHGGLLGIVEKTGSDLYHAAVNTPAGVVALGKGLATHPIRTVEDVAKASASDLRHPLRHPGYTLLDLWGLASAGAGTAARLGAVGKALEEGGSVSKALLRAAEPGSRVLKLGDLEVKSPASRRPLTRAAQRASDKALARAHETSPDSIFGKAYLRRVGSQNEKNLAVLERHGKGPAAALAALGKGLRPEQQMALKVVAEEAPVAGRIAKHEVRIATAGVSASEQARHTARIDLLKRASRLLDEQDGKPVFRAGKAADKLQPIYDRVKAVSRDREDLLRRLDLLSEESMKTAKDKALREALGVPLEHPAESVPAIPGQLSLVEDHRPQLPEASSDSVKIPDVADAKAGRAAFRSPRVGGQGSVGRQQKLGSLKENRGVLKRTARERNDTTRLVAEASAQLSRFHTGERLRHVAQLGGHAIPTSTDDIFVRGGNLASHERLPANVRSFLSDPEAAFLQPERAGVQHFDQYLRHIFVPVREMTDEQRAEFEQLAHDGKGAFVNKRVLGSYAKNQAPLQAVTGKAPAAVVDSVNNAARFAIFYAKPAYAAPNVLGNVALNLIQHGFAAPQLLKTLVLTDWRLGPDLSARIDALMGEGFARALSSHEGRGAAVVQHAANFWSKGVDTPFRRASFLREARVAGYRSPAQLEKLLTEPELEDKLVEVTRRANAEIIDYAGLAPFEREIIRRIIFVYPWLRGSTAYAAHFLAEHPVAAAGAGQAGKAGQAETQRTVGPVPSFLEGIFGIGGDKVINPSSAAILQSPAQIGAALAALAKGNTSDVGELANFLTPAATILGSQIAGTNLATGAPEHGSILKTSEHTLLQQLPQYRLIEGLLGHSKSKLYPPSKQASLLQFLLGGLAPRKIDRSDLLKLYEQEQKKYGG